MGDSPDAPLVNLVWYITDQEFQKTESVINSLDWDEAPWRPRDVGEQFGYTRRYNGRWEIPGILPGHQCGTPDQFARGSPWPYDGPPVEYSPDNIPLCCPRYPVGFAATGTRPAAQIVGTSTTSAPVGTGTRPAARLVSVDAAGALVGTGTRPAALVELDGPDTGYAGTGTRPAALVQYETPFFARAATGTRPASLVEYDAPIFARAATGTRPASLVEYDAPIFARAATGTRPASLVEYVPPPSGPGPTCATAFDATPDVVYPYTSSVSVNQWWKWDVGTSASVIVALNGVDVDPRAEIYYGECGALDLAGEIDGTGSVYLEIVPGGVVYAVISGAATEYDIACYLV